MNIRELNNIFEEIDEHWVEVTFTLSDDTFEAFIYKFNEDWGDRYLVCNDLHNWWREHMDLHWYKYWRVTHRGGWFFWNDLKIINTINNCTLCWVIVQDKNSTCNNCTKLIKDFKEKKPIKKKENPFIELHKGRVDTVVDLSEPIVWREDMWARGIHISADWRTNRISEMNETHLRNTIARFFDEYNTTPLQEELERRQIRNSITESVYS